MDYSYKDIKIIGFDLDKTLYPGSDKIDETIQDYIFEKIAEHKNIPKVEAKRMFKELYKKGKGLSGRKTLIALDVPNAHNMVQDALEQADIASSLSPNPRVVNILKRLANKYKIDLITGSALSTVLKKLDKLKIDTKIFSNIIDGNYSKSDGTAFNTWLSYYPKLDPSQFLYVGDKPLSDYHAPKKLGIKSILVNQQEQDSKISCPQLGSFEEIEPLIL